MSEPTDLMAGPEMHFRLLIEDMKACEKRGVKWKPKTGQGIRWAADRIEELEQQVCDECSPDDYGWNYNAVEGRVPCVCITESGAYQELKAKLARVETIPRPNITDWSVSDDYKAGWLECFSQVQEALEKDDAEK